MLVGKIQIILHVFVGEPLECLRLPYPDSKCHFINQNNGNASTNWIHGLDSVPLGKIQLILVVFVVKSLHRFSLPYYKRCPTPKHSKPYIFQSYLNLIQNIDARTIVAIPIDG